MRSYYLFLFLTLQGVFSYAYFFTLLFERRGIMYRKTSLLISLLFVASLLNNQIVCGGLVWWSDMDPNDHSWSSKGNWLHWDESIGDVVLGNEPNLSDTVYIGKGVLEAYWPPILIF